MFKAGTLTILFLCIFVYASPADDYLIINNTAYDPNKDEQDARTGNENASQNRIANFRKSHPNAEIVYIDESGTATVIQRGRGADRLVYVKKPLDLRETLEYIDGSGAGMNTDRRDPNRQVKEVVLCGSHGKKENMGVPSPFAGRSHYTSAEGRRTEAIGTDAWKKEFISWEKGLAARGISTKDLFKSSAEVDINSCYAARGQFPQYMANVMPKDGVVNAAKSAVIAGGINYLGLKPDWRARGIFRWEEFKGGQKTNSEMASADEVKYITERIEAVKNKAADFLSGKTTVANKDNYYEQLRNELMGIKNACDRAEPNSALDKLGLAMEDLSLRAGRGELTYMDVETLSAINESINAGKPISAELQKKAQFGMPRPYGAMAGQIVAPKDVPEPAAPPSAEPVSPEPPPVEPPETPVEPAEPAPAQEPIVPEPAPLSVSDPILTELATLGNQPPSETPVVEPVGPYETTPSEPVLAADTDIMDKISSRRQSRQQRLQGKTPVIPESGITIPAVVIPEPPPEPPEPPENQYWSTGDLMQEGSDRYLSALQDKMLANRQARGERAAESAQYQAQLAQEQQMQMQQAAAIMQQAIGMFKTFNAANQAYHEQHSVTVPAVAPVVTASTHHTSSSFDQFSQREVPKTLVSFDYKIDANKKYNYLIGAGIPGDSYTFRITSDHLLTRAEVVSYAENHLRQKGRDDLANNIKR